MGIDGQPRTFTFANRPSSYRHTDAKAFNMLSILIAVINVMANCSRIGINLFYATKMYIYLSWFDIFI